jgi:aminopeptidase N
MKIEVDLSLFEQDRYRIREVLTATVDEPTQAVTLFGEGLSLGTASSGYAYDGHTATFCVGPLAAGDEIRIEVEYDVTSGHSGGYGMEWGLKRRDGNSLSVVGAMTEPYFSPLWLLCPQSLHKVDAVYDDSPALDAVTLTVVAPEEGWQVFGPGGAARVQGLRHTLRATTPMPLYALSFAASDGYTVLDLGESKSGRKVKAAVSSHNKSAAAIAFEPAVATIDFMEERVGPYSFEGNLYFVEIPGYSGGMEHVGAIWMGSPVILPSELGQFVTVHETVHMWWGNAVRFSDWPHFWLAEGFDEWSTNFGVLGQVLGPSRFEERQLEYRRDAAAISYTGLLGNSAGPLRFGDGEDMLAHFNSDLQYFYVYGAGALDAMNTRLLRRNGMGLEPLLADWFADKRLSSVTTEDFLAFVGEWTGEPKYWQKFFNEWIYASPCPTIGFEEYAYADGKAWLVLSRSGGDQLVDQLELAFVTGDEPTFHTTTFLRGETFKTLVDRIEIAVEVPEEPYAIAVDPDGLYVLRLKLGDGWMGPELSQGL